MTSTRNIIDIITGLFCRHEFKYVGETKIYRSYIVLRRDVASCINCGKTVIDHDFDIKNLILASEGRNEL